MERNPLEHIDFTIRRRLNKGGVVLQGLQSFWTLVKALGLALIYFGIKHPAILLSWQLWAGFALLFILQMVFAYVQYKHFYYYVDEAQQELLIEEGVFNKSKTVIKFENILQVNIKQNVFQQALDLYGFEIESAGSKEKEADLYALDQQTADTLKAYLSRKGMSQANRPTGEILGGQSEESEGIFRIPNKDILLVSLFSNYTQGLVLFFAFLISTFEQTVGFANLPDMDTLSSFWLEFRENWVNMLAQIAFLGLLIILIPVLINLYKYLITYYNFSLEKLQNGNLIMHYGLFQLKDIILNKNRVQTVRFSDNPILRSMGLGVLSLHQITVSNSKPESAVIRMPGINHASRSILSELLFDRNIYSNLHVLRPKVGLLINRFFKASAVMGPILLYLHLILPACIFLGIAWAVYALAVIAQIIYFFNYQFLVSEQFLIKRSGIWDREEQVLPINRILSVQVSQSIIQKRFQTANLSVSTSSGALNLSYFQVEDVKLLSDKLIWQCNL